MDIRKIESGNHEQRSIHGGPWGLLQRKRGLPEGSLLPADRFMSERAQQEILDELIYSKGVGDDPEAMRQAIDKYVSEGNFEAAADLELLEGNVGKSIEYYTKAGNLSMVGGIYLRVLDDPEKALECFDKVGDYEEAYAVTVSCFPERVDEFEKKVTQQRA